MRWLGDRIRSGNARWSCWHPLNVARICSSGHPLNAGRGSAGGSCWRCKKVDDLLECCSGRQGALLQLTRVVLIVVNERVEGSDKVLKSCCGHSVRIATGQCKRSREPFDCVGDAFCLSRYDPEAPTMVVLGRRAQVVSFYTVRCPRSTFRRLFVNDSKNAIGSDRMCYEVILGGMNTVVGTYRRIRCERHHVT